MSYWNNKTEGKEPLSQHFSPEPTKGEPANVEYKGILERRRVRTPAINGFGHKDYEHQFESKSQDSMDIAKNKATPSTQKEPEEPNKPKGPRLSKYTLSR